MLKFTNIFLFIGFIFLNTSLYFLVMLLFGGYLGLVGIIATSIMIIHGFMINAILFGDLMQRDIESSYTWTETI
jgi:hypothetical protein